MLKPLFLSVSILFLPLTSPCLSHGADDALVNANEARILIGRGQYEKAIEQLERAHGLFPLDRTVTHDLARAYAAWGGQLLRAKQFEQADQFFVKGRELSPDDPGFMLLRGVCSYYLKKYDIARYELEQGRRVQPENVELLFILGRTLYDTDDRSQAVELWRKALALSPGNREIAAVLERARREMAVEELMARGHSSRFDLTYDAGVDTLFALDVLEELERAANQVGAELGRFPTARTPVSIYTRSDYNAITAAPDWSGGVYDGTIRLPFGALRELTPRLKAVLHHEYAHVVVFDLTRGVCPLWLNEGIAEMFGRRQYNPPAMDLERAARSGELMDFARLERGFSGLSAQAASLAYQQSWSLVNYLVATYGWHGVTAILTVLGEGYSAKEAISRALADYSLSYEGVVREWRGALDCKSE